MKHELRSEQILLAATDMLMRDEKLSIHKLAREVGVSPSLVGRHFAKLPILYAAINACAKLAGREDVVQAVTRALNPPSTRSELISVGVGLAKDVGLTKLTRALVGDESGKAHGTVSHHFGQFQNFKDELIKWAVENEDLILIAQGLKDDNRYALQADATLQERAWNAYKDKIK